MRLTSEGHLICFVIALFGSLLVSPMQATSVTSKIWGFIGSEEVRLYTLKNKNSQEVDILTYGATITAIRTLDKDGKTRDVVLGFDNLEGYLNTENPYFGATVGRVANRIGKGQFVIDGVTYNVSKNIGNNTLHGGIKGWDKKIWNASIREDSVVMTLCSDDQDEGFPGDVIATATFKLTDDGELMIEMKALASKPTPINLTNHSYFNLAGHAANAAELYKHKFMLNADRYTVTDSESIPTGEIKLVQDTIMDLRNSTVLGEIIDKLPNNGFDDNFCIAEYKGPGDIKLVAQVLHPGSGISLKVSSNQPGIQFYTSNFLPTPNTMGVMGKDYTEYFKHAAFCLETQNYPDAINHPNFPDSVLRYGQSYYHTVIYKFGVESQLCGSY